MKIGCGILIFFFLLCGCSVSDHGRKFAQDIAVEDSGVLIMFITVELAKSGSETSEPQNTTDAKLSVPVVP